MPSVVALESTLCPKLIPYRTRIEPYRDCLPSRDYQALVCWLATFYPFQLEWVLDASRYAVANKSRQIGFSHSTAGVVDLWGAFHGELTTVISKGDRESIEVLDKASKHQQILIELGSTMAATGRVDSKHEISFASGGRVIALPASGGRSFTGNVFLDEYAYQERANDVWDSAMAVTLLGFRARVASTPNGIGNDFHHLCTDPKASLGWSKHEIPISVAIEQGFPVSLDDCWRIAKQDPRLFAQLFECSFLDGQFQYIPTEALEMSREDESERHAANGWAFAGLDIGRTADRTELYVLQEGTDSRLHVVHHDSCKRTSQDDLERMVEQAWSAFDIRRLCVDSTGLGAFPAERMVKTYGRARVIPVDFTLKSKETMATALYSVFVGDKIRIPRADKQLFDDLCSIQREVTTAANVRYITPHTDAGHGDSAWALALAVHAFSLQRASAAQDHPGI